MERITIKELSEKLGYSQTLISLVLSGKGNTYGISKKTQDFIEMLRQDIIGSIVELDAVSKTDYYTNEKMEEIKKNTEKIRQDLELHKRISLSELSKQLGYSKTLISMVLNGKGDTYGISKKTQAIVINALSKTDYYRSVLNDKNENKKKIAKKVWDDIFSNNTLTYDNFEDYFKNNFDVPNKEKETDEK